jgi:hypothetical protein
VEATSATEAGYQILPLLLGLIVSAIATGQIVAAVRRYKALLLLSLLISGLGLYLLTNIRPDTEPWMLWLWMAVAGLGVGPSFAIFTLAVQNAVPVRSLGSATSSVTLFQQVGGTIGLAITGTVLASTLLDEIPRQLIANGMPAQAATNFSGGGTFNYNQLTSVGGNVCQVILAAAPADQQAALQQFCPQINSAFHTAFSIATGATFVVGIATALIAAAVVLVVMPAGRIGHQS